MDAVITELESVYRKLASEHDVAPFMTRFCAVNDLAFRAVPTEIEDVLKQSGDWAGISCGPPVWLQINADNDHMELVLYRAAADHRLYLLAPRSSGR